MKGRLSALGFAGVLAGTLLSPAAAGQENTSIPFADLGNIRDWYAEGVDELYVQSRTRDWYRITFRNPCLSLPYVENLGFVTDRLGRLDRFSSVLVRDERCWFDTFEQSDAPEARRRGGDDDGQSPEGE